MTGAVENGSAEALAHVRRGVDFDNQKRWEDALRELDRAVELTPTSVCGLYNRGIVKMELRRYRGAVDDFSRAIDVSPGAPDLYWNRGTAKDDLSLWQEAVEDYDRALTLNPRHVDVLNNKGNSLRKLGRLRRALDCYDRALAIDPNHQSSAAGRRALFAAEPTLRHESSPESSCLPADARQYRSRFGFTALLPEGWTPLDRRAVGEFFGAAAGGTSTLAEAFQKEVDEGRLEVLGRRATPSTPLSGAVLIRTFASDVVPDSKGFCKKLQEIEARETSKLHQTVCEARSIDTRRVLYREASSAAAAGVNLEYFVTLARVGTLRVAATCKPDAAPPCRTELESFVRSIELVHR